MCPELLWSLQVKTGVVMHHFFVDPSEIVDRTVHLTGENYKHLKIVLRARIGEKILISDGTGTDYECEVSEINEDEMLLHINFREEIHELPADIYLFQGLPKIDKMELIIQKAVELGAHAIVPMETRNTVIRLDPQKADKKQKRWQAIAESAAKQSKRSMIPEVLPVMSWKQSLAYLSDFSFCVIPYENAKDIHKTLDALHTIAQLPETDDSARPKIAVMIGPEGGFSDEEIKEALAHNVQPITLGKRILRTETAAICAMSILMITLESEA